MSKRLPERKHIAAYHEAGHTIAALDLGWPIKSATIVRNKRYDGMLIKDASPFEGNVRLYASLVVAAAGPLAHGRFAPENSNWGGDLLGELFDEALSFETDLPDNVFEVAQQIAEELIERRWPAIERVAQMLLERKTLSGAEIQAAVPRAVLTLEFE